MGLRQSEWSTKAEKTLKTTPSEPSTTSREACQLFPLGGPLPHSRARPTNRRSGVRAGVKDAEGLARNLPDWPWGAGSRRAGSVTGPTGFRAQGAVIFSGRQHRGSCEAGAGAVRASLYITALVFGAGQQGKTTGAQERAP